MFEEDREHADLRSVCVGVILTALEACKYPFAVPDFLHMSKRVAYRVSAFAEDLLDLSVSRSGSLHQYNEKNKPNTSKSSSDCNEKALPKPPSEVSGGLSARSEAPIAAPQPSRVRLKTSNSRGWGEEWTSFVNVQARAPVRKDTKSSLDSGISLTYDSSSGYVSSSERSNHTRMSSTASRRRISGGVVDVVPYMTVSRRTGMEAYAYGQRRGPVVRRVRPRVITPSSSISNISRRSPLSSMRFVTLQVSCISTDVC